MHITYYSYTLSPTTNAVVTLSPITVGQAGALASVLVTCQVVSGDLVAQLGTSGVTLARDTAGEVLEREAPGVALTLVTAGTLHVGLAHTVT